MENSAPSGNMTDQEWIRAYGFDAVEASELVRKLSTDDHYRYRTYARGKTQSLRDHFDQLSADQLDGREACFLRQQYAGLESNGTTLKNPLSTLTVLTPEQADQLEYAQLLRASKTITTQKTLSAGGTYGGGAGIPVGLLGGVIYEFATGGKTAQAIGKNLG